MVSTNPRIPSGIVHINKDINGDSLCSDDLARNATLRRRELTTLNAAHASLERLPHASNCGENPMVSVGFRPA
jgi:hypothetical protein